MKTSGKNIRALSLIIFLFFFSEILSAQELTLQQNLDQAKREHLIPGNEMHMKNMRGYRYVEVLLFSGSSDNRVVNFYNSIGLDDPSIEHVSVLNPERLAKENNANKIILNPVYFCLFDELSAYDVGDEKAFNGIKTAWSGVVGADDLINAFTRYYAPNYLYRNSTVKFLKGSIVYLLDSPDGEVFIMQSYTKFKEKELAQENLKDLGSVLNLPKGWKFRVKVLDKDLLISQDKDSRQAYMLYDNLYNLYQGSDGGKAFSYIP